MAWQTKEIEARKQHFVKGLWARLTTIFLGAWLITSPFTFGYLVATPLATGIAPTSQEHIQFAVHAITYSDVITGILVIFFGLLALSYRHIWPSWILALLGVWLEFAPIVFWSPSSASYLNDSVVGALIIAFSILVPKLPFEGMIEGKEIPPGWSYNPSSWLQRIPVIFFGFLGWMIARYLSAYQLGYVDSVWDPFFHDGTLRVITSNLSRSFPISDAGLGAIAYALEALMGGKGGPARWRTMPWLVLIFTILVVPLGFCSILLVMMQPIIVGAWCGLCLVTAAGMLIMMALSVDELVAVVQFLVWSKRAGQPFWHTFWFGGCPQGAEDDNRTPLFTERGCRFRAMGWGALTIPWTLVLTALLGAWMMAVPQLLEVRGIAANYNHIFGALSVALSVFAWAEAARPLRYLLILFGGWIMALPWLFGPQTPVQQWNNLLVGVFLIILSIRRGRIQESYGSWDRFLR